MYRYLARRLLQALLVIFGVMTLTFFSLQIGGDPTYLYISERATPEQITATRTRLGFDRPVSEQYLRYLGRVMRGDLGASLSARVPATSLVLDHLPATIELTLASILISTSLALPIGIFAALNRGNFVDRTIMLLAMIGQSIPNFWLGLIFILYIGLRVEQLPISGYVPILEPLFQGDFRQVLANLPDALLHLLMPSLTIALVSLSRNARMVRSGMVEVLSQEYIKTARSKGLRERYITRRHALPNAIIPVITLFGLEFGFLLSGVVVVETLFSWPGVGRLVFNAIGQRDIPVVQASVLLFSFIFVFLNLIMDLIYVQLDPRIKLT